MSGHLVLIVLCMLGAAFFAGIETGVISINRLRLKHRIDKGERWAIIIDEFLEQPDRLLGTTLVGVNICIVIASIEAAVLGEHYFQKWGEAVAGVLMTILILVLSEYIPKAWFQGDPIERCRPYTPMLRISHIVLRPFIAMVNGITALFIPGPTNGGAEKKNVVTKDELDILATESAAHGQLSPRQRIMIHRVVELSSKTVRQIMTAHGRIISIDATATAAEFLKLSRETKFTRIPVWDAGAGAYTGIVSLFDVLAEPADRHGVAAATFARPVTLIPETTPVTEIFPRLRVSRQPLCLVTNAQNEVVGLVTTEDVLQSIVGTS